jgi:glucose-1-phosphate adenylyltransferase
MAMTKENPPFEFHDEEHQIYTNARSLPGVRIGEAEIKNAIICEGSQISKATVTNSIVGVRGIVHPGARLDRSVMLGAESFESERKRDGRPPMGIGQNAQVSQAIIDHNARIGKNVVIKGGDKLKDYDGDGYAIRDGIVVVYKNAIIKDGTQIG